MSRLATLLLLSAPIPFIVAALPPPSPITKTAPQAVTIPLPVQPVQSQVPNPVILLKASTLPPVPAWWPYGSEVYLDASDPTNPWRYIKDGSKVTPNGKWW